MDRVNNISELTYKEDQISSCVISNYAIESIFVEGNFLPTLIFKSAPANYLAIPVVNLLPLFTEFITPSELPNKGLFEEHHTGTSVAKCPTLNLRESKLEGNVFIFMVKDRETLEDHLAIYCAAGEVARLDKEAVAELMEAMRTES